MAGVVELEEFKHNILDLGLYATDAEVEALFRMLDDDGSGALELSEIKPVLRKLHEAVLQATAEEARLERSAQQMMKKSIAAQQLLNETEQHEQANIMERREAREKEKMEKEKARAA